MDSEQKVRICISVCERTVAALEQTIAATAEACNVFELRLDCLEPLELESGASLIKKLLEKTVCDWILTFRPAEQGGRRKLDYAARKAFWDHQNFPAESFLDIELDLVEGFNSRKTPPPPPLDWNRVICSQHDFVGVPKDLDQIYERMAQTPARILKIAVQAKDATDCLPVFHLLARARKEGREMIAIAMGPAGVATRILGPSRGAFLTYGSLRDESATAPGQISVSELRHVYRIETIDRQTQIFGLIGQPVFHSFSPRIHNAAFAVVGINAVYLPIEVRDVNAFVRRMVHPGTRELDWNVRGLSVTAPHKSIVMDQLNWIEPAAREIGAVNTILIEDDALRGYNTDVQGFIKPLTQIIGELRDARCALIGAGGAAAAALWALKQEGAKVTLFARNIEKAKALAQKFGVAWNKLEEVGFDGFDVVINATPLGTRAQFETETPAIATQLRGARLAYDLVYNPGETRFLQEARDAGCETLSGLPMLVMQAAEQFRLWTGREAPESVMYEAATDALHKYGQGASLVK